MDIFTHPNVDEVTFLDPKMLIIVFGKNNFKQMSSAMDSLSVCF